MNRQRDFGWLEGIIDGEGSLGLDRHATKRTRSGIVYNPRLRIGNTDTKILARVQRIVGSGTISGPVLKEHYKPFFSYQLSGKALQKLLLCLVLTSKNRQRLIVIESLSLLAQHKKGFTPNAERLNALYEEMRGLNRRGT